MLGDGDSTRGAFDASVIVLWGGLTSSRLQAQSYEEAGTRALIPCPLSLARGKRNKR